MTRIHAEMMVFVSLCIAMTHTFVNASRMGVGSVVGATAKLYLVSILPTYLLLIKL